MHSAASSSTLYFRQSRGFISIVMTFSRYDLLPAMYHTCIKSIRIFTSSAFLTHFMILIIPITSFTTSSSKVSHMSHHRDIKDMLHSKIRV